MTQDHLFNAKDAAGYAAAQLVEDGMSIGLGTGSTAACFIRHLSERIQREGLKIQGAPTSKSSYELAKKGGISLIDIHEMSALDLTVDGVDQITPEKQMIKGGGGALLREKIVAQMSREMIVIADETKQVESLEGYLVPIEIIPFGDKGTILKLEEKGYIGGLRKIGNQIYITENHNYIVDVQLPRKKDLNMMNDEIKSISGVVETGLFLNLAGRVIIGKKNGSVERLP